MCLKKIVTSICIILIMLSLYNDFNKEMNFPSTDPIESATQEEFSVKKIKINPGDTVISISEKLNHDQLSEMSIEQILQDFSSVNPFVDVYDLTPNEYYFFPVY